MNLYVHVIICLSPFVAPGIKMDMVMCQLFTDHNKIMVIFTFTVHYCTSNETII